MFTIIRKETKKWEKSNIMIRLEKKEEHQKVENLVRESFWNVYRPGCLEHYVLHQLRNDLAFVPELDFVMFLNENGKEDKLIGQNMFMRNLAVVQSALRETLIFMEKVDSDRQANLTFVIMDWKKGRMHLSFCAKS